MPRRPTADPCEAGGSVQVKVSSAVGSPGGGGVLDSVIAGLLCGWSIIVARSRSPVIC